jgi:hypothetical protein
MTSGQNVKSPVLNRLHYNGLMDSQQRSRWLRRGAVLVVVFAGAVGMHAERLHGWGFLVICILAGSLGGLGAVWARKRLQLGWNRMSKRRRGQLIGAAIVTVWSATLIVNYGRPDAAVNDLLTLGWVILALMMWGLYHLFSRFLDALWVRITNR